VKMAGESGDQIVVPHFLHGDQASHQVINLAVAVEPPFTENIRTQCLLAYRKAHDRKSRNYDEIIQTFQRKGDNSQASPIQQSDFYAAAQGLKRIRNKQPEDFELWFMEDQQSFQEFDADKNGVLDKQEFTLFVRKLFDMTAEESETAMKKWDIDDSNSIGPYEFVVAMAVWHTHLEWETSYERYKGMQQQNICCEPCAPYFFAIGLCCSTCTLCLSWIPTCCQMFGSAAGVNEGQQTMVNAERNAQKAAKKEMLDGPGKIISQLIKEAQAASPATAL